MVEIHYHLLFGVDDGPRDIEASLELAEASIAEGVTHIVSTPHSNDQYIFKPEVNRERIDILQQRLGNRVQLALGCDFQVSEENLQQFQNTPRQFTVNGGKYLLVEFSDFGIPKSVDAALRGMIASGFVPIITHPERNSILSEGEQVRLGEWLHMGCLVQITAGSLTGFFGPAVRDTAFRMLRKNWVQLVASDAHGIKARPPAMGEAYQVLKKRHGVELAERLCVANPMAVFAGGSLGEQPEPQGLDEPVGASRRGFFSRMFGS